ncbi:cell adhesion molecule 4-like [Ruditapes philippinarum]|uniref:cell adhesion molecule 4-like n=1 Tax=Ruditapes philippinarum TaxID=129788 RepID=UPI00295A88E4|nr:cell adhesion molecule 4-like [Ruditapes philippinarum]
MIQIKIYILVILRYYVYFDISVTPENIEISFNEIIEGTQCEFQCIAINGRPPLNSNVYIDGKKETDTMKKIDTGARNMFTITTLIIKKITRLHNQVKVMCCSTIGNGICRTKKVNVLFPPKDIHVEEMLRQNQDNGKTRIELKYTVAESNPKSSIGMSGVENNARMLVDKTYERKSETHGWALTVIWTFNFTRFDGKREIKCQVRTDGFPELNLEHIYKLNITYSPIVNISWQENKDIFVGDDVHLTCHVESNPPSTISWYKQSGLIQVVYDTKSLDINLTSVSTDYSGTYTCTAHNGIDGITSKNISLIVKESRKAMVHSYVLGLAIGIPITAVLTSVISFIMVYKRRKGALLVTRTDGVDNEYNGSRNDDTDLQAGYESLARQDFSKEVEMYTQPDNRKSTELPVVYENSEI